MQFILLNTIKYGDKAFVLQVYSREEGRISLFLRGVGRNSNYRAWMHKLSIMEAEMVERSNGMPVIKEMRPVRELLSIRSSVIKGGIALFMSELVLKGIREVEASREMFDFLVRGINLLEECREGVANFPIYFLTHFCRVAGFAPTDNYSPQHQRFSPLLGRFVEEDSRFVERDRMGSPLFEHEASLLLHLLLQLPEEELHTLPFDREVRYRLAGGLLGYLSLHLGTPVELKSLDILHQLGN